MSSGEARLAGVEGFEPSADGFGDRCSTRLSYTPARCLILRGRPTLRNEAHVTETESPSLRKGLTGGRTALGLEGPAMPFYRQGSQTQCYREPRVQPHCWQAESDGVKLLSARWPVNPISHDFLEFVSPFPAAATTARCPVVPSSLPYPHGPTPAPACPSASGPATREKCYRMLQNVTEKKVGIPPPTRRPQPHSRARNDGRPDGNPAARGCSFALTGHESRA